MLRDTCNFLLSCALSKDSGRSRCFALTRILHGLSAFFIHCAFYKLVLRKRRRFFSIADSVLKNYQGVRQEGTAPPLTTFYR